MSIIPLLIPFKPTSTEIRSRFWNDIVPAALDQLTPETPALWGRMSAQHMVEHLHFTFAVSNGKHEVAIATPKEKLPAMHAFLFSDKPMPHGFISPLTGDALVNLEFDSMVEAKQALLEEITRFRTWAHDTPERKAVHPVFGELDGEGWDVFHFKHSVHHFSQFGLVTTEG